MIGAIMDRVDRYLGRGRHSIAVPVMDGPLHPNKMLDEAATLFEATEMDNLIAVEGAIWFSSGAWLMRVPAAGGTPEQVEELDADITCLAESGLGTMAIGVDGKGIVLRGGSHDGQRIETVGGRALLCPTAALFLDDHTLVVTVGARERLHADWKRDLMAHGKSGEVWKVDLTNGNAVQLADGLAYPYGVCQSSEGLVISEAWAHRVVLLVEGGKPRVLLDSLPGYPGRIINRAQGGYLLCIFAPRNQLVEFVLREPEFLRAMTETVHPDHWIVPSLMWGQGFKEPMQGAALKTMGIIKPWAPTWSYGLLVLLNDIFDPIQSFHSRADGDRHGVTSAVEFAGTIVAGSKGAGVAVSVTATETGGAA